MASLEFSKQVPGVQPGQQTPAPYHKQEKLEVTPFPNFQAAMTDYAAGTNWMSSIGSAVSSRAAEAIATKIGGELGKNPQGNLIVPLTNFDKTMQQSYNTQAQATLSLQANKLITDSHLETAKASRITPGLIQRTNDNIASGIRNIIKNAPDSIKPHMELQLGNAMLNQSELLTKRMISEQREDQKNQNAYASSMNAQHAYSFALNGNEKAALDAVETTRKLNESSLSLRLITPENAKANIDSARKSYLNGKMIKEYNNSPNKEAYLKSIAEKKPGYLSDDDYMSVTNNLLQYVNHQNALRSQDQQLRLAKFQTSIAMDPMAPNISSQLQELKDNVSPESYERAQLYYVNAIKSFNKEQGNVNDALSSWNDPSSFARLTEKGVNKAFDMQVNRYVQQNAQQGSPISIEEAEVQVAASAGGKVPVFEKSLENKLLSGNPNSIVSATKQISLLNNMEQGRVYAGISTKAKAISTLFQQQRGSMPDNDLARQITDNLSNIDDKMQKTLDNSWGLVLSAKGAAGMNANKTLSDFALIEVGLVPSGEFGFKNKHKTFGGSYFATIYGNDIYNQLNSNFIATRGDYTAAVKMTKEYADEHYGDTYINGDKQKTDSPIEKSLGYKSDEITPFIQKDLLNQLQQSFDAKNYTIRGKDENGKETTHLVSAKEAFDKKLATEYWETLPLNSNVAEVVRHIRTKEGKKSYRYPINLVGHAGNQWDVVAVTPTTRHNLFLIAPQYGVVTYVPNKEAIEKDFKANKSKGWFSGR